MAVPSAPTGLTATDYLEGVTISWDTVAGATSYNLYYLVNKCPNDYFSDISLWTITGQSGASTQTASSGKIRLTTPDGNTQIFTQYKYKIASGDFIIDIDFDNYSPNDPTGIFAYFRTGDQNNANFANLRYHLAGGTHYIRSRLRLSANNQDENITVASRPNKWRIERSGTTLKTYYYISSWVEVDTRNFGSIADNIKYIDIGVADNSNNGGYIEYDNFIVTPAVIDNYSGVITGITDTSYNLTPFMIGSILCIEVTAVNAEGEGSASLEAFGISSVYEYHLGPDTDNLIRLYPNWDYSDGEQVEATLLRSATGKLFERKIYDFKRISFTTDYVPSSDASFVNSWWDSQAKLIWQIELGSEIMSVSSVMLMNNSAPFMEHNNPYTTKYKGQIILEEYT